MKWVQGNSRQGGCGKRQGPRGLDLETSADHATRGTTDDEGRRELPAHQSGNLSVVLGVSIRNEQKHQIWLLRTHPRVDRIDDGTRRAHDIFIGR